MFARKTNKKKSSTSKFVDLCIKKNINGSIKVTKKRNYNFKTILKIQFFSYTIKKKLIQLRKNQFLFSYCCIFPCGRVSSLYHYTVRARINFYMFIQKLILITKKKMLFAIQIYEYMCVFHVPTSKSESRGKSNINSIKIKAFLKLFLYNKLIYISFIYKHLTYHFFFAVRQQTDTY